jgi:1-deoxy-D-xylulose-5-phosphate reductoisomerase
MKKKKLSILGSTGSIGVSTLQVVERFPERFEITGLAAGQNRPLLEEQIERFHPKIVSLAKEEAARDLRKRRSDIEVLSGVEGLIRVATLPEIDMVVSALVGAIGLIPTVSAIRAGKDIALANKESLVMAGEIVMKEADEVGVKILPVDSEHSAIYQCLLGHRYEDIRKIILTASGGPFIDLPAPLLKNVTPQDALKHPNWKMGPKITIDSATLMNKGLEVIEARYLFGIEIDRIDVLLHPQSIIHSAVEFKDGSIIAQMALPDMKGPISYALSYPERLEGDSPSLDLSEMGALTFMEPDPDRFPCLPLAYSAIRQGGTAPAVLNASNEVAVKAFLEREIEFMDIPVIIKETMDAHKILGADNVGAWCAKPLLDDILKTDQWARDEAIKKVKSLKFKVQS